MTAVARCDCFALGRRRAAGSRGQASVELVGGLSALLLAALVGFQLLTAGYAAVMADHAAEAAALALATDGDPAKAARAAIPGWPRDALRVSASQGRVAVELTAPSPLALLGKPLVLTADAAVQGGNPPVDVNR